MGGTSSLKTGPLKMLVFLARSHLGGFVEEEVEVHRGADCLCSAASRDGHTCGLGLPEAGDHGADILPLEAQVWGFGGFRAPALEAA